MKTSHNLNNDMHTHDCLFIHCEATLSFIIMRLTLSFIIMRLTLSFVIMRLTLSFVIMFMLYALQFKFYDPILYKSCFLQIQ
jgi:hypothetical protein